MIISTTSIPPRMAYLPHFYKNLARQKHRPDAVELYVARNYRRFPGAVPELPPLPEWVKVIWVEDDLGPATKILPAARAWRGKDVEILFCDDDRNYDPEWAGRFHAARKTSARTAFCESGLILEQIGLPPVTNGPRPRPIEVTRATQKIYRLQRVLSLGLYRPRRPMYGAPGFVDIVEGFGGVLVRPDWFEDSDFDIPDILWTVDDVWLSGHLVRRGIALHTTEYPLRPPAIKPAHHAAPLAKHVEIGADRMEANRACVRYFQDKYGIWL